SGCAPVPGTRAACHPRAAPRLREARGATAAACGSRTSASAPRAPRPRQRARDPDVHPETNGLMVSPLPPLAPLPPLPPALRRAGVVAAGLVAAGLVWAARDAWPWRRPLTAAPIASTAAYAEFVAPLGRREALP